MSWKAEAHKIYEARVLKDALARLGEGLDVKGLPLSDEELRTLARRTRESVTSSRPHKHERLARYKAHLAGLYGEECVGTVSAALESINNAIAFEEK